MILNYIWIAFFIIAFVVGLVKLIFLGDAKVFPDMVNATFDMSKTGFEIALFLTGILSLWMGLLKIGENAGIIKVFSKLFGPFFQKLLPEVPKDHPVFGFILMNFSANLLNLDNAATPMGLKAMTELQTLNPKKDTASNAQIMFMIINSGGLTLIPMTVMAYRAQGGAADPSDIFLPILLATSASTFVGVLIVSLIQKINLFNRVILAYGGGFFLLIAGFIYYLMQLSQEEIGVVSSIVSNLILFSIIISFILLAVIKKINVYDSFIEGAKDGFGVAVTIIPYIVAILVGIGVFRASGALNILEQGFAYVFGALGMNTDWIPALPTALMKPLSGSGARGLMLETMSTHGADSFVGKVVSAIQGSTDTTLYGIAVYFGAVNISRTRYVAAVGLFGDFIGLVTAILLSYLFFH
ncbi:MAG TPA: nucleoside recognition domain-containing protein [Cytophagales bacterium]|nr:nucleoside recognition domain-containing protein [Cytophagales bacterium]